MKILFFTGRNDRNISRVSWKIWKIQRKGKRLQTWWGPAALVRRKAVPKSTLQTQSWNFRTDEAARQDEQRRIREKLNEGYERNPTRRRRAAAAR
jgi:predicted DNA-binding WGR domain protein